MDFTLDQLMALDAIVRTGSFAKAASDLDKVPSAISYNVQGLESVLGVDIFDRSRRKAVLTSSGARLLEATQEVLERARNLKRIASELSDGWESELHVVVDGALPMDAVMNCIRRFGDVKIPTRLRLDVEYEEGVVDRFDNDKADLALVLGFDGDGDDVGYDCTALPELELLLVASPEHPLAGAAVTDESRAQYAELVVRDSSPRFARQPKASFMGSRNVVYLSDFHSKRNALLSASGYGWIPRHFVSEDIDAGTLIMLDADVNCWTYYPQIVTRENQHIGRGGQLFLETLNANIT